jgi:hypothetical protein
MIDPQAARAILDHNAATVLAVSPAARLDASAPRP